ncbi:PilZ domain-containing protein [Motiliproteus sp. MSK22-1]|uniref:PilZ domain-containing protein n=1 Tax=Motiliproteus sp. MSK22-1 TaxID=1897630 RepID=UPI0009782B25|nr:hypothetical protein BGP75_12115 [Motiliproteus sp. MSK22-1]
MREFIRHPSDIPISICSNCSPDVKNNCLKNISLGGLCISTKNYIEPGCVICIKIQVLDQPCETTGIVAWCKNKKNKGYEVGIKLENSAAEDSIRMVEQVCHIEHYRRNVLKKEGRRLNSEEAAKEWITLFADKFPR